MGEEGSAMTTTADVKARVREQWSGAADAWDRRFEWYSSVFRPMAEWCCTAARLAPGMNVLDVACGSGLPAFAAAERVGSTGRVTGIDFSLPMLESAARRARRTGLAQLEFLEMDAENLAFDDASFDAVTCTCGVMFFPDADRAVAEMRRVLKPGGRVAIAAWDEPSKSTFLTAGGAAVAQFFPPAAPNPNAPGGFRFSAPGSLEGLLRVAEFRNIVVESVPVPIELASPEEYWDVFTDMAAGIKMKIEALAEPDRARLRANVEETVRRHVGGSGFRLFATPLCAAADA